LRLCEPCDSLRLCEKKLKIDFLFPHDIYHKKPKQNTSPRSNIAMDILHPEHSPYTAPLEPQTASGRLNICNDAVFKAVFTKDTPESRTALKSLLSAFLERELSVLVLELFGNFSFRTTSA